jgi:hypothetical protein
MEKMMNFDNFINENYILNENIMDWFKSKSEPYKKMLLKYLQKDKISKMKEELKDFNGLSFKEIFNKVKTMAKEQNIEIEATNESKFDPKKLLKVFEIFGAKSFVVYLATVATHLSTSGLSGGINWTAMIGITALAIFIIVGKQISLKVND